MGVVSFDMKVANVCAATYLHCSVSVYLNMEILHCGRRCNCKKSEKLIRNSVIGIISVPKSAEDDMWGSIADRWKRKR